MSGQIRHKRLFGVSSDLSSLGGIYELLANKSTTTSLGTSNTLYPTQNAVKTYVDNSVVGLLDDRGNYDASGNVFPSSGGSGTDGAILKGDIWRISVAGTLGTIVVIIGDWVRALSDSPGQTASNWSIAQGEITTLTPQRGGTGVSNNSASTITISGNFATTLTLSNTTNITLPTTGTLNTLDGVETLTNKTLISPKLNENVAITTTATKLNYITSVTGTTGTTNTNIVFSTSPILITPTLGAASATSINGLTITSSTGTLTITNLKTLSITNSLTFSGTDSSTLNIGGGGTLGSNAYTSTTYAPLASPTFTGTVVIPTPFTLGAISVTSTGTQLNYLSSATGTTGTTSTNIVYSTSPTLTTPNIGVASGTSITLSSLTINRVPFASTAGLLIDSANLNYDTSTQQLLIGTSTVAGTAAGVHALGGSNTNPMIRVDVSGTTGQASLFCQNQTNSTYIQQDCFGSASAGTIAGLNRTGMAAIRLSCNTGGVNLISGEGAFDLVLATNSNERFRISSTGESTATGGGLSFLTVGKGITIKSGTGQRTGNTTLVGGTVTVSNTTVTANTIVLLTRKTSGGTIGTAVTYTLSAGVSFTINSDNILDTSTFSYYLIELN